MVVPKHQNVIYKYTLENCTQQTVKMPEIVKMLSVQVQDDFLCVWAIVRKDTPLVDCLFHIRGTGEPLPADQYLGEYLGTVQMDAFVWHIFYERM